MVTPSLHTVLRPLVIAIAMLWCGEFAPGRAVAGCGDYNMPEHPPEIGRLLNLPEKSPAAPRCHGPNCRQAPSVPAPLREAPARLVPAEKVIADALMLHRGISDSSTMVPGDQDDLALNHFSQVIFHPPR